MEKRLTKEEVANIYNVSPRTIDAWVRLGHIPFIRHGRRAVCFDSEALKLWEKERANLAYQKAEVPA